MTKKFWCHYLGSDGNTPKRRSIELTDISELLPNVSNDGAKTPLWYEVDGKYYLLYVQLNDKVAVKIREILSYVQVEDYLMKTDADFDAECRQIIADILADTNIKRTQEQEDNVRKSWMTDYEHKKKHRNGILSRLAAYQDCDNVLLSGDVWINIAMIRAYQEVQSPIYPILDGLRRRGLQEREEEARQEREERKRQAEEEARKKAEAAAKEEERLSGVADKCRNGESIAGPDVVELCRRYGIAVHLRTVHNLQQVIANINGKDESCQYYSQRGKRKPSLDGCFKTARELYDYLQTH